MPRVIPRSQWPVKGGGLREFCPFTWTQRPTDMDECGGFSGAPAFTALWNFQFRDAGSPIEFSASYIFGTAQVQGQTGLAPRDVLASLRQNGACLRATIGDYDFDPKKYTPAVFAEAMQRRIDPDAGYEFLTFDEAVSASLSRFAPIVGFYKGGKFRPNKGYIQDWDGQKTGAHDIAAIGPYERTDRGEYLWCLNADPINPWIAVPRSYFEQLEGKIALGGVALVSGMKGK